MSKLIIKVKNGEDFKCLDNTCTNVVAVDPVLSSCPLDIDCTKEVIGRSSKPVGPTPTGPARAAWLNNSDIDKTLHSLSVAHKGFYHIPFQMIDFAGTDRFEPTELGKLDILDVMKKYTSMGVVINTDKRTGPGIHWFAIYVSFDNPISIEYFNSGGNLPYPEIQEWMIKTQRILEDNGHKAIIIRPGNIVHQRSSSECGVYSLYYIWRRLNSAPYSQFINNRIEDDTMFKFRNRLFRSA